MSAVLSAAAFREAMRQFAAAVTIVTVSTDQGWHGITATAVCSLSAEPARLLCCINRSSYASGQIQASGCLAVNVLGAHHADLAESFAGRQPSATRFASGRWTRLTTGAPVLEDALASFDCVLVEAIEAGTHSIILADVRAMTAPGGMPLLYHNRLYCGLTALAGRPV